jgi:Cryptococcal mannosyltransferase 1
LRSHWNKAIEALVLSLGPENVYVSIYESGSWDNTKGALRVLDQNLGALGVGRTIILNETTHVDEITQPPASSGWIDTPRGKKELRRIPYLSALRNLSLRPLEELAVKGVRFDKILFLNDVVFTVWPTPFRLQVKQ